MAFAVDDVGPGGIEVAGCHQGTLDAVLHLLYLHRRAMGQLLTNGLGQCLRHCHLELAGRRACRRDGALDLVHFERRQSAIALAQ